MNAESKPKPNRRRVPWLLGAFVLLTFVVLILLQTSNLWKDFTVETASDTLLLYALSSLNFFAFVIFGFIFLRSILKLARERRALQLGSRIKTRLLIYFAAISILPIVAMAGFSYLFMNRAIERWFTQIPENVVREAREVERQAIADQSLRLQETTAMLAGMMGRDEVTEPELKNLAELGNLTHIEVVSATGATLFKSGTATGEMAGLAEVLNSARTGNTSDISSDDERPYDIATAPIGDGRRLIIVPEVRSGQSVSAKVDNSLREFDRLKDQQITVRQLGFLTLGVLTFLLIFASSWTAFYIARGLTVPIKALAEGADEIARGNLSHRVDVIAEDELDLLVGAFNQMSSRLEGTAEELRERRRYIETVLESLPTGVISFDAENRLGTINRAAIRMLRLEDADFTGLPLEKLVSEENRVVLGRLISRAKRIGHAAEQTSLRRETTEGLRDGLGELPVALTATALQGDGGAVLVIEDLSELITAQRASAWQEVARRMAHEIKNPLTPIQLSAERIAKRFRESANGSSEDIHTTDGQTVRVVQDGTNTILREVQSLKSMVDEFSRFARLPNAKPERGDLNDVVRDVLKLYEDRSDGVRIDSDLGPTLPATNIDAEQMKRVFVNLIENALEAFDGTSPDNRIKISTAYDPARDIVVAKVADNGKGISPADLQKLFQPYFSTKGRGTGLGLAIVQRIISEHGGKINVVGNQPKGAKFIIELPTLGG
ncbi:MAG: ATP-binding protein [Pyrinomonadaceae bacterium]|nr:ATP-binding protein [Pyrinomonadaceae bacterium]